ncbi:MAG: tetratricopeptide repeat protein [Gammaproteobacteria bacterium]
MPHNDNSVSPPAMPVLDEAEFAVAVREALRHYHRPDHLRENPLLRSQLFAAAARQSGTSSAPTQALKDMLHAQFDGLGDAPEIGILKRVLELTFLKPMRSQQAVADALNMSWSTYRRRLADAVKVFTTQLWEAEIALAEAQAVRASPADEPPSGNRHSRRLLRSALGILGLAILAVVIWLTFSTTGRHEKARPSGGSTASAAGKLTLAVLPFLNMNDDPAVQHLSDGLTEELINRLGRIPGLRVTARTSAFVYRNKAVDVREAARTLGVENVLEGSVQNSGDTFRVRVALVNARGGYELWSDEYNVAYRELFGVEDTIAKSVIEELHLERGAAALAGLKHRSGDVGAAAHHFYLVGLEYLNRRTVGDIGLAIAYFRRAIQADPNYARAWSGAAMAYAVLSDYNSDAPPDTHYADALAAADKAIALDDRLPGPHAVLGQLHEQHWEWRQAKREFRLALKLDSNDVTAHQWYAIYLWFTGDMQGALKEMQIAHTLDPLSPIVNADLGRALLYTGDTEDAIAQSHTAINLDPGFALAHLFLAEAYMAKGDYGAALREMQTAVQLTPAPHPASYLSMLGLAYALTGDRGKAHAELDALTARSRRHYVSGVSLALLYWALDDKDKAFSELERAVTDHDRLMMPVVADREAAWTADPRYKSILAAMHLPITGKPKGKPAPQ